MDVQRFMIGLGLVILVTGIAWPILSRIGLGRLPVISCFNGGVPRSIFLWSPASSSALCLARCSGCLTVDEHGDIGTELGSAQFTERASFW
jgi:hypothetical protein